MKTLQEYFYITEAWGVKTNFAKELSDLFASYEKSKANYDKRKASGKSRNFRGGFINEWDPVYKLAKYPVAIMIEKTGLDIPEFKKMRTWEKKSWQVKYGKYILDAIEKGDVTKEDMINWWKEYEEKVAKEKFYDPSFLIKQVDPSKVWNPYYPKDSSIIDGIIEEPARLTYYLKDGNNLSYTEKEELRLFLADPANQETLSKILKSAKKKWEKVRPTFKTGVEKNIEDLIENRVNYDGGDLVDLMKTEYADSHKSYYQGANSRMHEASAVIGLVLKAINKLYGFEVWNSITVDDPEDRWATPKATMKVKGEVSDETLEGFLNDVNNLKIEVKNLGISKEEEKVTVWSSSFTSSYRHDFEVIIYKDSEKILDETYKNISVGSYFYSGGWD